MSSDVDQSDPTSATTTGTTAMGTPVAGTPLDLDAIERDLAGVEVALARLEAGTYWTDEVSGDSLPDALLEQHPTARTAG